MNRSIASNLEDLSLIIISHNPPRVDLDFFVREEIKNFLAQKFGVAFMSAETDEELKRLKELWFQITGERK